MTLFKDEEEFRKVVSVNGSTFDLENIMGDILLVERDVIRRHLGPELHKELLEAYTNDTLTDEQKELLQLVQFALGNLAMVSYLAINQVLISDGGITKSEHSAYRYQVRDLKLNLLHKGYNGLESVLEYLEANKNKEIFAKWSTFSGASVTRELFINSAKEFSREYAINDSRLTYLSLQSIIRKVETFMLEPVLGTALFDEIKAQIQASTISEENQLLLKKFIRPAVAHFVAAKAIAERSFKFSGDTISLNMEEMVDDSSRGAATNNDGLLLKKIEQAYIDGTTFSQKLKNYLNLHASATKYATYFSSELYTPAGQQVVFRNSATTKVFAFI